jgi:hypothetical protein
MARPDRSELARLFKTIDPKTGRMMLSRGDADFLGRVIDELQRLGSWSAAPPLWTSDGPDGRSIGLGGVGAGSGGPTTTLLATPTFVRLRGGAGSGSSPYGYDRVAWNAPGSWVSVPGGIAGSTGATEVYGRAGLGGKVVQVYKLDDSNYLFEWARRPSCSPCSFPWGSDLHITFVENDPPAHYCPNHVTASGPLIYHAGSIADPANLSSNFGLPNSPGYWDTGCIPYTPYSDPYGVTFGDFSYARAVLACTATGLSLWLAFSHTSGDCATWPPPSGVQVFHFGTSGLDVGWNRTTEQCDPLLLQWDYCGGFACASLITDTGCTYKTITITT